jgi:phosphoglycerol geranylgeranyltransferase
MMGKTENYLLEQIKKKGTIHFTLVDPDKSSGYDCASISVEAEKGGSSAIMIGGSTLASQTDLDEAVQRIKSRVKIPVILFPNGPMGVSKYADAVWFMSLLNSQNSYYFIDAQMLSAPVVKQYRLEAIPMGYLIAGDGCVAGYIGHARHLSFRHPKLAVGYSLAAEALGMRFIYLEAGSGALEPIPPTMIGAVKKYVDIPIIVGGGIRNPETALTAKNAGASAIVTGTLVEEESLVEERIREIVKAISN